MKNPLNNHLFIVLAGMISLTHGLHSSMQPLEWHGDYVVNVVDNDLVIDGNVTLPSGTTIIEATNLDVNVFLTNNSTIGSKGNSVLNLIAHEGHAITFTVDKNLIFNGTEKDKTNPLLIIQEGQGVVNWQIAGGKILSFGSKSNSGGTGYYLLIRSNDEYSEFPLAIFQRVANRSITDSDKKVTIEVGSRSSLGYLSTENVGTDAGRASFVFDASSMSTGLMALEIQDQGSVIVSPRTIAINGDQITYSDIDLATPAGGQAMFQVVNGLGMDKASSLFIVNSNTALSEYLFDPFLSLGARNQSSNYIGSFKGNQYGFVVGANGLLSIGDNSNINYVGLSSNQASDLYVVPGCEGIPTSQLLKVRNGSALIFDQSHNPLAQAPQVSFGIEAGLFLRSGFNSNNPLGNFNGSTAFTLLNDELLVDGLGNFVVDVEGQVDIVGSDVSDSISAKIELLSLAVNPTGGSLFVGDSEKIFPLRTFAQDDDGDFLIYNKGAFFINGSMNLKNVGLVHTDENSLVFAADDVNSEPVYVGGDTYKLLDLSDSTQLEQILARPKISFINSDFILYSSAAVTGLDLLVPNRVEGQDVGFKNVSEFIFGYNGYQVDNGVGRSLILGTFIGSTASDGKTIISDDAHIDVMQTQDVFDMNVNPLDPQGNHTLVLKTAPNSNTINPFIGNADITGQFATQSIFLGNRSNISIGTNADSTGFYEDTHPWLRVSGDFFAFNSDVDNNFCSQVAASRAGLGGIFVDLNGKFSIDNIADATIATMVTRSRNGILDLPAESLLFNQGVGITQWNLDLNDPAQVVIVDQGEDIPDYTLDWGNTVKSSTFLPYPVGNINLAVLPSVVQQNVTNIPTIKGHVGQLQIVGSRLGDPVHIKIKGGSVDQIVFAECDLPGEAPVAVIILEDDGVVGVGSSNNGVDSSLVSSNFGRNGLIFISNGNGGRIVLNDDVQIKGLAPFLFGPDSKNGEVLKIQSESDHSFTVNKNMVLDFRGVTRKRTVEFGDQVNVVMEPASKMILGGGTIRFADNAELDFDTSDNVSEFFAAIPLGQIESNLSPVTSTPAANPHNEFAPLINYGTGLRNTDSFRVSLIGQGVLEFADNAKMLVPFNAFVGVENLNQLIDADSELFASVPLTQITLHLTENSQALIGEQNNIEGGVLQIGNVQDFGPGYSVSFFINVDGSDARFEMGSQAVLGFAVGVVSPIITNQNNLLVDNLFNVASTGFQLNNGVINISRIWDTDDARSNIVLIGDNGDNTPRYTMFFKLTGTQLDTLEEVRLEDAAILGGSPLAYVAKAASIGQRAGAIHPIVRSDDNQVVVGQNPDGSNIISSRLRSGMVASSLLQDLSQSLIDGTALDFFNQMKTADALVDVTPARDKANTGTQGEEIILDSIRVGTVSQGTIIRDDIFEIFDAADENPLERAIELGAVFVSIDPDTNQFQSASQIPE